MQRLTTVLVSHAHIKAQGITKLKRLLKLLLEFIDIHYNNPFVGSALVCLLWISEEKNNMPRKMDKQKKWTINHTR